jgi:signal transduction histidine kinase/sugar lactone lactonase YvrE
VLHRIDPKTGAFRLYRHHERDPSSISDGSVLSTVEDKTGLLWFATFRGGLNSLDRKTGRFTAYRHDPRRPDGPSSDIVMRLELERTGQIWVAMDHNLDLFDPVSKRFRHYPAADKALVDTHVVCMAQDRDGVLWLGTRDGLLRFNPSSERAQYYKNDPAKPTSLINNRVNALLVDRAGVLWVGTQGGLDRFDAAIDGFRAYTEHDGLPNAAVQGILEDRSGNLWLSLGKGLANWNPRTQAATSYYVSDGLAGDDFTDWNAPFESARGEMFFPAANGITVFYPGQVAKNNYVPAVVLTDFRLFGVPVNVGGDSPLHQPILATRSLSLTRSQSVFSFGFSSLSYAYPERNRYRYRLEGLEQRWNYTESSRRFATYTTLAPREYVFRVQGSNNQGIWNENGVSLHIRVLPPWWNTTWFRALCPVLVLALAWAAYQFRVRRLHREFALILEARVGERARIARELHDTLLQSFQGLIFRFQSVDEMLPARSVEAKNNLQDALDRADQAINEGRDAITGIRTPTLASDDLAESITALMTGLSEELAAGDGNPVTFRVLVEGAPRAVRPILHDEIYRIARECLRNAFRHAQARHIETEIMYGESLRLRFRDDGKGIDSTVLKRGGRSGHWGLAGIRERAKQIGAQLEVWSQPGTGTEIELSIPGSIAYEALPTRAGFRLFRRSC